MDNCKIHIKRFIVIYIIVFGLASCLAITLFAWIFGFIFIQEKYTRSYIQAAFDSFDSDMKSYISQLNLISFDLSSNIDLMRLLADTTTTSNEKGIAVQAYLENTLGNYPDIRQIDILSALPTRYSYVSPAYSQKEPLSPPKGSFISALPNNSMSLYDQSIFDQANHPYLVFGRNSDIGFLLIYLDESAISSQYGAHALNSSLICLENNGKIISCSDTKYIGKTASLLPKALQKKTSFQNYTTYTHQIELTSLTGDLNLIYLLSTEDLHQLTNNLNRLLLISLCSIVFVCLLLVLLISRTLFASIDTLCENLTIFSMDYTHAFYFKKHSELEYLEYNFLLMAEKIRSLISDIEKEKDAKRVAELKALQSQINPHFIYNSIDAISWMTKLHKPYQDIEKLAYNLGLFFRLGLHKGDTFITVAEELQHVKSYLAIEQLRFPDKFDVTMECDPEIFDLKVIKIILQPIVENSINHGFNGITYRGKLSIRIFVDPFETETIVFEVTDNGIGTEISGSLPKSKSPSDGYALKNVNERLCLEYGSTAALSFTSKPGEGTVVSFRISKSKMFV